MAGRFIVKYGSLSPVAKLVWAAKKGDFILLFSINLSTRCDSLWQWNGPGEKKVMQGKCETPELMERDGGDIQNSVP